MKKMLKKALALFMAAIMLTGCFAFSAAAVIENDLPVIYLRGASEKVYDKNGKQVWPVPTSLTSILMSNSSELLIDFGKSLATSDWSIYGDSLAATLEKHFAAGTLDNNGNPKNGTTVIKSPTPKKKTSNFALGDYIFRYDPRLDPWDIADELEAYIKAVLAATGKRKIQLVSHCMGSCIASAYLCKYGNSKVDTTVYYASAARGVLICGQLFAGRLNFDADVLNEYANEYMGEDDLDEFLSAIVNVTYSLNLLSGGTDLATSIYKQLAVEVFPKLLRITYANMPAYWAMVNEDYYEEAKEFIFGGHEAEYSTLIKRIDRYHENVMLRLEQNLRTFDKNGTKVLVVAKYGTPFPPYLEGYNIQGDGYITIDNIAFGAIGADIGKTLSMDYLNEAKKSGTIDYVSDDLIIDSSTCLFPESTWFIRDIEHDNFPHSINNMMLRLIQQKKKATVNTFEEYPRFMKYNHADGSLTKVTEPIPSGSTGTVNPLMNLINILLNIFTIFKNIFAFLF